VKRNWLLILGGVIIVVLVVILLAAPSKPKVVISDFGSCAAAGHVIMESYPPQCAADGKTYTQDIGDELNKADQVKLTNLPANTTVKSPLEIEGQAKGPWFSEASLPVKLVDDKGNPLAEAIAQAQADSMTSDFVPFKVSLTFNLPVGVTKGNLVFEKDNPSGDAANAESFRLPVKF